MGHIVQKEMCPQLVYAFSEHILQLSGVNDMKDLAARVEMEKRRKTAIITADAVVGFLLSSPIYSRGLIYDGKTVECIEMHVEAVREGQLQYRSWLMSIFLFLGFALD